MKTFTKEELREFMEELNTSNRYVRAKEEPMPKGFFSSSDLAKKYNIAQRVSQRWLSESLAKNELEVKFVRRRASVVAVRRIPVYKFKSKADEKSFKSRHKRKQ